MTLATPIDQLLTIAEISIALAGFAGIVATFQFRKSDGIRAGHVVSLAMIVNISLVGAFFSVLPIVLMNFGVSESQTWAVSSALMGINILVFVEYLRRHTTWETVKTPDRVFFVAFVFCFALVCYNFSRLLLRPLWRLVRQKAAMAEAV